MASVDCPICEKPVIESKINDHLDSRCESFLFDSTPPDSQAQPQPPTQTQTQSSSQGKRKAASFFGTPAPKRQIGEVKNLVTPVVNGSLKGFAGQKRSFDQGPGAAAASVNQGGGSQEPNGDTGVNGDGRAPTAMAGTRKRSRRTRQPPWLSA